MNESPDEERVVLEALCREKRFRCLRCDREILFYVPLREAILLTELVPGYCAPCLRWGIDRSRRKSNGKNRPMGT